MQSEHAEEIDFKEAVAHANTFCQFDLMVTCKLYGYKSLNDYYRDASSAFVVEKIRVPTLFLNSLDDPISDKQLIPYKKFSENEYIVLGTTKGGGHVGHFESYFSLKQWIL